MGQVCERAYKIIKSLRIKSKGAHFVVLPELLCLTVKKASRTERKKYGPAKHKNPAKGRETPSAASVRL